MSLRIVDEDSNALKELDAVIPAQAEELQAWIISLDNWRLHRVDLPSGPSRIVWKSEMGGTGVAAFTYRIDDAYVSTPTIPIDVGGEGSRKQTDSVH